MSLLGTPEAVFDAAGLLDEDCGRGSLGDKGERTIGIDGDNDRDNKTHVILRALVEFLGESHDVNAVLTERRTYRAEPEWLCRREFAV